MNNKTFTHHSHITGEITGYAHSFCNTKVRENKYKITVVGHNLFRVDFFSLLKDLKVGVWRTEDLNIGSKNPTGVSSGNISNQTLSIDTIKYFQQGLGALANLSFLDNMKNS